MRTVLLPILPVPVAVRTGFFGAGVGSTTLGVAGRLTAATTRPATGTTPTGSGWFVPNRLLNQDVDCLNRDFQN